MVGKSSSLPRLSGRTTSSERAGNETATMPLLPPAIKIRPVTLFTRSVASGPSTVPGGLGAEEARDRRRNAGVRAPTQANRLLTVHLALRSPRGLAEPGPGVHSCKRGAFGGSP